MENKEKQVEEMQFIMLNAVDKRYLRIEDVKKNYDGSGDKRFLDEAKALYTNGCRIISNDDIVFSREEYQKDFSSQFNKGYKYGSKETAEKIYKEYLCDILSLEAKEEFAKQFGIEMKE